MPVPIAVLNKLKPSKIILGFQIESGWSLVDSLNNAAKINRVANKLRLAQGALMYAEIYQKNGMLKYIVWFWLYWNVFIFQLANHLISFLLIWHFEENFLHSYWVASHRLLLEGDYSLDYCADPFIHRNFSLCLSMLLWYFMYSFSTFYGWFGEVICTFQTNIPLWPLF